MGGKTPCKSRDCCTMMKKIPCHSNLMQCICTNTHVQSQFVVGPTSSCEHRIQAPAI